MDRTLESEINMGYSLPCTSTILSALEIFYVIFHLIYGHIHISKMA